MGFKTQRQYHTSITDYESVKEVICKNKGQVNIKSDPNPEKGDRGNFTFYIKKCPEVRIQITSKKFFVKLHGVKLDGFARDLEVIRRLTSVLATLYPEGIDFKLDKSSYGDRDKDEVIRRLKGETELLKALNKKALESPQKFREYIKELSKLVKDDLEARRFCSELGRNYFAKGICTDGFRCKPDGSIKLKRKEPYLADILALAILNEFGIE